MQCVLVNLSLITTFAFVIQGASTKHHFTMTLKGLKLVALELEEEDSIVHEPSQGHQV
jgi:hypothetical protein